MTYDLVSRPVFDDLSIVAVDRFVLSTESVSDCGVTVVEALDTQHVQLHMYSCMDKHCKQSTVIID